MDSVWKVVIFVSLVKKLLIKPNMRIGMVNQPEDSGELLGELPPGVSVATATAAAPGSLDLVLLWVKSLAELDALAPQAIAAVKYDGLLWIVYPKKSSKIRTDIDRDSGWERMRALSFAGVAMVAVNETWSAMRYRPAERVGK